jgi:hypothetical protein
MASGQKKAEVKRQKAKEEDARESRINSSARASASSLLPFAFLLLPSPRGLAPRLQFILRGSKP